MISFTCAVFFFDKFFGFDWGVRGSPTYRQKTVSKTCGTAEKAFGLEVSTFLTFSKVMVEALHWKPPSRNMITIPAEQPSSHLLTG